MRPFRGLLLGYGVAGRPKAIPTDPPGLSWVQKEWTAVVGGWDTPGTKAEEAVQKLSLLCPLLSRPLPALRFGHIRGVGGQEQRVILLPATIASEHHGQKKPLPPAFALSILPFLPSSSFAPTPMMHCLRASRVCCSVLTAHSTFSGLRLKLGGLGQKRLVTSCPSLRGKERGGGKDKTTPAPPPAAQLFGPAHEIYTWPSFLTPSPSTHIHPRPSFSIRPRDGGLRGAQKNREKGKWEQATEGGRDYTKIPLESKK